MDPEFDKLMQKVHEAQLKYANFSQEMVDQVFFHAAAAANKARIILAKELASETGMGIVEDKVIKNVVATQFIYEDIKNQKTVGIISEDEKTGIIEIAEPIGPIFAITPVTNPTSTVLFKILIALKSRNQINKKAPIRLLPSTNE